MTKVEIPVTDDPASGGPNRHWHVWNDWLDEHGARGQAWDIEQYGCTGHGFSPPRPRPWVFWFRDGELAAEFKEKFA